MYHSIHTVKNNFFCKRSFLAILFLYVCTVIMDGFFAKGIKINKRDFQVYKSEEKIIVSRLNYFTIKSRNSITEDHNINKNVLYRRYVSFKIIHVNLLTILALSNMTSINVS